LAIGKLPIVVVLSLCRWNIPNRLKQSNVVEPVHPLQGGQFHGFLDFPGSPVFNQLGLVKPVDGFCQRVVLAVLTAPLTVRCHPIQAFRCGEWTHTGRIQLVVATPLTEEVFYGSTRRMDAKVGAIYVVLPGGREISIS
jgi:hypothetical protein